MLLENEIIKESLIITSPLQFTSYQNIYIFVLIITLLIEFMNFYYKQHIRHFVQNLKQTYNII